ncbi:type VI secretion system protein ImpL [Paraburkholderia youngii]
MKRLRGALLWVSALLVTALVSWGGGLYWGRPLWVAIAIFVGVLALYLFFIVARRIIVMILSRRRLAAQTSALNMQALDALPEAALRRKWNVAITTLRQSSLSSRGNPLYGLPWFMIVGQSGTGKTTALTRARLSSPVQKISQQASIDQTASCDWWYFDRAVVIDCAGRYVLPEDIEGDRREWDLMIKLLGRYRPRDGIDGLVIAVNADRLTVPHADTLADEGRIVRARIEQLIRMFNKRFPVYVLVTKCDRVYGFEEWMKALPIDTLSQAMGYLAEDSETGETTLVSRAFDSIGARLRVLRLGLVAREAQASPELLMFPNELEHLRSGLSMFVTTCFADSPYLERPLLRGIFFSSGQQEGGAMSALMGSLLPTSPLHPRKTAGVFLRDFFDRILPQDRGAAKPAMRMHRWWRFTWRVGGVAWALLLAALGILISMSLAGNRQTLELVRSARPDKVTMDGDLSHDAAALTYSDEVLMQVARNNRRWMSGLLGNRAGLTTLEARLHDVFVQQYRQAIQPVLDHTQQAGLRASVEHVGQAREILNLARSVSLVRARLDGADRSTLDAMPQPVAAPLFPTELNNQLHALMISYLVWSSEDADYLRQRLRDQRARLDQAIAVDPQLTWLIGLVPDNGGRAPVRAADFWGSNVQAINPTNDVRLSAAPGASIGTSAIIAPEPEVTVPAAYTTAGRKELDGLAMQLREAVSDPAKFDKQRAAFDAWYRTRRVVAWQNFVEAATRNPTPYLNEAAWRSALGAVSAPDSPYFRLIARLSEEFDGDFAVAPLPGWLVLARQFQQLLGEATGGGAANKAVRMATAINAVGAAAIKDVLSGEPKLGGETVANNLRAVDALALYLADLNKLAIDSSMGSGEVYQLSAHFHQSTTTAQPSEMMNALQPLGRLRSLIGSGDGSDMLTWRLITGPFDFLAAYIEQQASCELQREWESGVMFPLSGAVDYIAAADQLFGPKGTVWAFADGAARPFLVRNASRYSVVETHGVRMPFTSSFVPMLNDAFGRRLVQQQSLVRSAADKRQQQLQRQWEQLEAQRTLDRLDRTLASAKQQADAARTLTVPLTITAHPTNVNAGTHAQPYATILTVHCASGPQTLSNYNFPIRINFAWTAGQCGDARLEIRIGNLTLGREYAGPLGLAAFLRDFASGQRQFGPSDFPDNESALKTLNVQSVTLSFGITGGEQVIGAAREIELYETLQKTTAQQKQQIQDEQLQRQDLSTVDQINDLNPPLPTSAPTVPGKAVSLAELGLPATIGACWRGAVP